MLRKDGTGTPFPYTPMLAKADGMVEVEMTFAEIKNIIPQPEEQSTEQPEQLHKDPVEKPGPGWVRNKKGTWQKKKERSV